MGNKTIKQCIGILVCFLCMATHVAGEQITCTVNVVDANANPIAGAEVAVYEEVWAYMQGQRRLNLLGQIQKTNHDGSLSVNWVKKKNSIVFLARKEGLAMNWERMDKTRLKRKVTLRLDKPSILAGRVVDEAGKIVAGVQVRMCLTNDQSGGQSGIAFHFPEDWFSVKTDSEGKFSFTNIADDIIADFLVKSPGRTTFWTFEKWGSQPGRQFPAGRTDIEIIMPVEARIKGRVADSEGKGIAGIRLLARAATGNANYFAPDLIVSGDSGEFCYKGLAGTIYSLQVVSPEEGMAQWIGSDTKVVCQTGKTTENVSVTVGKGGIVELIVRDAENNQLLGDIWYSVTQKSNYGRRWGFGKYGRTDADGRSRIRMPIGPCGVSAGENGYSFYQLNPAVTVTKDKVTQLEIVLDRDPAISGTVRDEAGLPVVGAVVDVLPTSHGADYTDSMGKFEVSWRGQNDPPRKYVLAQYPQDNLAALVEIKGESEPMDIVVKPGLTLAGQVTDPKGKPIPVARVRLSARLPGWITNVSPEVITDVNGRYEISAIPPAPEGVEYRISVGATGYAFRKYDRFELIKSSEYRFEDRTFTLKPANLSVSGIVVDPNGMPVAGRVIHLSGSRGNSDQPRRTTATNEKGEFYVGRMCSGPLRIQAGYDSSPGGAGFLDANGGDENVKVIVGQTGVHVPYGSLVGKALPDLSDLKLELSDANNMMILCFFDMQQRPSRHCVKELVKQAQQLKEKGITVAIVQASKIGKDALDQWVKKYDVPFPVGMIEADEEKTRFTWGVKSLPWLILTDEKHIVQSNGFGLTEIDQKIKALANN